MESVTFTIQGEPASKANSRKAVVIRGRPAFIKSDKARNYVKMFEAQCPQLEVPFTEDVKVEMIIYYSTRRPDLDESLILDCMQGKERNSDRIDEQFVDFSWSEMSKKLDQEMPVRNVPTSSNNRYGLLLLVLFIGFVCVIGNLLVMLIMYAALR